MGLGGKEEAKRYLASFSVSKNPDVNCFLHERIIPYEEEHASRSFFAADDEGRLLGFYSIAIATYQITGHTPEDMKARIKGLNRTNSKYIPGILIGQIARFDSTPKDVLSGTALMNDALNRIRDIHNRAGLRFAFLDCADNEKLLSFYQDFGFTVISRDERFCHMIAFFEDNPLA